MSHGSPWSFVVIALCLTVLHSVETSNTTIQADETGCIKDDSSENFPGDLFTDKERRHGAFLFHIFVGAYFFIVIAFVCNDYFLPSVDCICQDLNLSKDVAGATFMAFATSTPELFTNIIGTFLTESDLGVGTVVGSAICNIMAVPGCGGLAATTVIKLEVYPFARDCTIYITVIAVLAGLLWDDKVYWYEALVLVILYFIYCFIMFCDKRLTATARKVFNKPLKSKTNTFESSKTTNPDINNAAGDETYKPTFYHGEPLGSVKRIRSTSLRDTKTSHTAEKVNYPQVGDNSEIINSDMNNAAGDGFYQPTFFHGEPLSSIERARSTSLKDTKTSDAAEKGNCPEVVDNAGDGSLFVKPKGFWPVSWWIFTLPVEISLWTTIPDCRTRKKLYPLTFIMCVVWIGVASYMISWMMTLFGNTFRISDAIMGITFLAIGGSVPEGSSSVINARKGIGSMTISNALGANTLDILLCLGVPWMIKTLLPASMRGGPITIQSSGLMFDTAAQIVCVAILFVAATLNKFYYNRVLGAVCILMYLAFIGFIIIVETNVFGWTHAKPEC